MMLTVEPKDAHSVDWMEPSSAAKRAGRKADLTAGRKAQHLVAQSVSWMAAPMVEYSGDGTAGW